MARRGRLLFFGSLGALLVAAGAFGLGRWRPAERRVSLGDACRTPARQLEPLGASNGGAAVLFHGLSASAAIMEPLGQSLAAAGWRVYLLDLPGHGRSIDPFTYSHAVSCAAAALDFLERQNALRPARTVLIGHSLGGAAALRLARRFSPAAVVAISPAPTALPRRFPPNLLILAAQFDLAPVKKMSRELLAAARGPRSEPRDFLQRDAVALEFLPAQLHGSMVLDPRVWRLAIAWAGRATGAASPAIPSRAIARPLLTLLAQFVLLGGLLLLVAPLENLFARLFFVEPPAACAAQHDAATLGWRGVLGRWALASLFAVCALGLLRLATHVRPVRLEDGDWAALTALLAGVVLAALSSKAAFASLRFDPRAEAFSAASAVAIVLAFALALRPELAEAAFNSERLWRWAALVGFLWPYFLAEEAALGAAAGRRRFFLFLAMRAIVWLAQLFALLVFWRWGLILVLMGGAFAAFSVGQRLAADALRRRGAGLTSAAFFDAILAAGFLAFLLPIT